MTSIRKQMQELLDENRQLLEKANFFIDRLAEHSQWLSAAQHDRNKCQTRSQRYAGVLHFILSRTDNAEFRAEIERVFKGTQDADAKQFHRYLESKTNE